MSAELSKELVCRLYEQVWSAGRLKVVYEIFAGYYVRHELRAADVAGAPEGEAAVAAMFRAAFPDLQVVPDLLLCDGAMVTARWTAAGTHDGAFGSARPTGNRVVFCGIDIFRFDGGRVVEMWNHRDDLSLLEQVGVTDVIGTLT